MRKRSPRVSLVMRYSEATTVSICCAWHPAARVGDRSKQAPFRQFVRIWLYFVPMGEHRAEPRDRTLKAGTIEFDQLLGPQSFRARSRGRCNPPHGHLRPFHVSISGRWAAQALPVVRHNNKRIGVAFD